MLVSATWLLMLTMEPFVVCRLAYDGSDPSDTWKITHIGHSRLNFDMVNTVELQNLTDYEVNCQLHSSARCSGHMCRTPSGILLPMQSLSINSPVIKNDIYKAARDAFSAPSQYHSSRSKKILSDSLKTKTGRMRKGILNCHVDGSLRMVITPQVDMHPHIVAVPHYLQNKWAVVYLDEDTNKYKTRYVQPGDYAIMTRPPALSKKSVQPVIVVFWNETCMGVSPELVKEFDGDYDGDEMHLYPVYSPSSIEECKKWTHRSKDAFDRARDTYMSSEIPSKSNGAFDFMDHTTLSFTEISMDEEQPLMAEQSRTTQSHLNDFKNRYDTENVSKNFMSETIRGMGDTNMQQLSQPIVGDMSRIARISSSCIIQRPNGDIGVAMETEFKVVCRLLLDEEDGNSCIRGISTLCAGAQQITLESHHAKKKEIASHDLVTDLMVGSPETYIIISSELNESRIRSAVRPSWFSDRTDSVHVLCKPSLVSTLPQKYILGSYNPIVLSSVDETRRLEVCKSALDRLIRCYKFAVSERELLTMAILFSYWPEASSSSITTKDGIIARKLRWTESMMANHYTGLAERTRVNGIEPAPVETVSACLMAGNFIN